MDRFGTNTLRVLEEEPELISRVSGISERKAREIVESYRYQTGMRRLLEFLSINSLPLSLAMRLYRRYGADALEAIHNNPYLLVDEMYGVDFSVMDEIAISMGISLLGLTNIIKYGYGYCGYLGIAVVVIPFLTVGVYKNRKYMKEHGEEFEAR